MTAATSGCVVYVAVVTCGNGKEGSVPGQATLKSVRDDEAAFRWALP